MFPARPGSAPNKWLTLIAVCLGLSMLMIDMFVVNVAFPAMGRDLRADLSTTEWAVSGYVLALGVLPLAMGRLGDIFGRKRIYLFGLIVFVAASAGCAWSESIEQLIALRVVQGVGAAVMMPGTLSILTQAFPPEQRGLAIGLWGGVSGLGLIAGPILGGLLVNGDEWRWIFIINIPVGVIALAMATRFIAESRDPNAPRSIDVAGVTLLAGGLTAIMYALTEANDVGWGDSLILGLFAAGAALLGAFWLVELRLRYPLVDVRLFRNGTFTMACVSAFLFSAAVFGSQPFTSLFMQNYLGFSPLEGGLAFLPATVLVATLMPFSGIMAQRLGSRLRLLLIAGALAVGGSFAYLVTLTVDSGYLDGIVPAFVMRGLGIGLVMSASSLAVMSAVPVARSGLASGTLTMARQVGTAVGVALFGAVFLQHIRSDLPNELAGVSAPEAAAISAAAEHFVPAGDGAARESARESIVEGFVLLSEVGVAISVVAAGAALFVRHRSPAKDEARAAPAAPLSTAAPVGGGEPAA
jgi:EmrB/QacA subfamily drug resistance transporter